jgi:hypothetical protein
MKVSQLIALLSKVPADTEVEVHLDMLDDEDPIVGNVKGASLALSEDKDTVLVIAAEDAHPEDDDEGGEEE